MCDSSPIDVHKFITFETKEASLRNTVESFWTEPHSETAPVSRDLGDKNLPGFFRRRFFSLEEEHSDAIHGETDLGIARAGAHYCGMVLAGLNSLLQYVWKAL
jgi:hypothetical protein